MFRNTAASVSVALCTYRGSSFIGEQLESIFSQTRLANQIVIRDDESPDDTIQVINEMLSKTEYNCELIRAETNEGSTRNFEQCIKACSGEIVVLSDQDDVWHREKLNRLLPAFDDPSVGLVFSDANMIDSDGKPLGYSLWEAIRFGQAEQNLMQSPHAFDLLLRRFVITGATMAFRRSLVESTFPFTPYLIHDAWIALFLSAISRVELVAEPLIDYRQHQNQQIGEKKLSLFRQYQRARKIRDQYFEDHRFAFASLRERLTPFRDRWVHPGIGALLEQKVEHAKKRVELRQQSRTIRIPTILVEGIIGRYGRFSYGWKSIAQDLFL